MKKMAAVILLLIFVCVLFACGDDSSQESPSIEDGKGTVSVPESPNSSKAEISTDKSDGQHSLDEFFAVIGTNIKRSDIEATANNSELYIDYKNSGTGIYTYRIAAEEKIASTIYHEKGSCVTVSFNGLKDDVITEITYFDENRMIAGYWSPDTGYLLTDYNYPQIVYHDEDTGEVHSRIPVSSAKEIIDYSSDGNLKENLLEDLFASVSWGTTKDDVLTFVNEHGLSYNSRGAGNEQVIAYCYEIGDKYGVDGSYITFATDSNNLITRMTYLYYPANYRNGYRGNFYSEGYATDHSIPSGFVLESKDDSIEYSSAEELLLQLHN